jgi:hypothetical protein
VQSELIARQYLLLDDTEDLSVVGLVVVDGVGAIAAVVAVAAWKLREEAQNEALPSKN